MRLSQSLAVALVSLAVAIPAAAVPYSFTFSANGNTYTGQLNTPPPDGGNRLFFTAQLTASTGAGNAASPRELLRADNVPGYFYYVTNTSGFFFLNYDGVSVQLDFRQVTNATFGLLIQFFTPNADQATATPVGTAWPSLNACPVNLPSRSNLLNGVYRGFPSTTTVTVASSVAGAGNGALTAVVAPPIGNPNPSTFIPPNITFPPLSPDLTASGVYDVPLDCVRTCVFIYLPNGTGYFLDVYPRVALNGAITFIGLGAQFNNPTGSAQKTIINATNIGR